MKELSKEEMKKIMGGQSADRSLSPCSTGKCGPNNAYNCSVEYDEPEGEHTNPTCCCGHSDYNDDCMAA